MTNLISGKEALIALANGEEVEACVTQRLKRDEWHWFDAKSLNVNEIEAMETDGNSDGSNILAIAFRLKPRTTTLNGIEVPAPFEPKVGEEYWFIADYISSWYSNTKEGTGINSSIGKWRTEEEIKQVVAALRQIFGGV
jgi:hypothetical protein